MFINEIFFCPVCRVFSGSPIASPGQKNIFAYQENSFCEEK